jgi:predicted nucleic acid-binding protein
MRVYVDSSALLKRGFTEPESDALEEALLHHVEAGDLLLSSSLAMIEVSRALRRELADQDPGLVTDLNDDIVSGVMERPITADVVSLARRIGPTTLRSLDAIHLATAILIDAAVLLTYDARLAAAGRASGIAVASPTGTP